MKNFRRLSEMFVVNTRQHWISRRKCEYIKSESRASLNRWYLTVAGAKWKGLVYLTEDDMTRVSFQPWFTFLIWVLILHTLKKTRWK